MPVSAAPLEVRVLPGNRVALEHDRVVGAAAHSDPRPVEHESLTEEVRLLRVNDYETVVSRLRKFIVDLPLDDLRDSCLFVEITHSVWPSL